MVFIRYLPNWIPRTLTKQQVTRFGIMWNCIPLLQVWKRLSKIITTRKLFQYCLNMNSWSKKAENWMCERFFEKPQRRTGRIWREPHKIVDWKHNRLWGQADCWIQIGYAGGNQKKIIWRAGIKLSCRESDSRLFYFPLSVEFQHTLWYHWNRLEERGNA